jgi:hypothetical protein
MMPRITKIIFIGFGVIVLAAAAYLAAQWMNSDKTTSSSDTVTSGGTTYKHSSVSVESAPETPQERPAAYGPIKELTDEGLILSRLDSVIKFDSSGAAQADSRDLEKAMNDPANQQEIIVTAKTKVYLDTSNRDNTVDGETVQQTVELITFDEVDKNGYVTVWGEKRGDRIIADVIFYMKY